MGSLPSFPSSTTSGSTMMFPTTPEKELIAISNTRKRLVKEGDSHTRYGSMDTIDRLEVDLGSPFERGERGLDAR